jgi:flagellar basal body P-ring protein FlgI
MAQIGLGYFTNQLNAAWTTQMAKTHAQLITGKTVERAMKCQFFARDTLNLKVLAPCSGS